MNKPITSYMYDTSPEMQEYQYRLIMSKSPEERFIMGLEMAEAGRELMLAGIRQAKPGLSEDEYKIELLRRMILHDKSLKWLEEMLPG
jgi:hypothetical protein